MIDILNEFAVLMRVNRRLKSSHRIGHPIQLVKSVPLSILSTLNRQFIKKFARKITLIHFETPKKHYGAFVNTKIIVDFIVFTSYLTVK